MRVHNSIILAWSSSFLVFLSAIAQAEPTFTVSITNPPEGNTLYLDFNTMELSQGDRTFRAAATYSGVDVTNSTSFSWELRLEWVCSGSVYREPENGPLTGTGNPFYVGNNQFVTGGTLHVLVRGTYEGYTAEDSATYQVRVQVPGRETEKNRYSDALGKDIIRAVAWQESTWHNYNSNGEPRKASGTEDSWGIMQVNRPSWETHFNNPNRAPSGYYVVRWNYMAWDWTINIHNGKYIHQTYLYYWMTDEQKGWPETSSDINNPNKEDLATYGYNRGVGNMRSITRGTWNNVATWPYVISVRDHKENKPWE